MATEAPPAPAPAAEREAEQAEQTGTRYAVLEYVPHEKLAELAEKAPPDVRVWIELDGTVQAPTKDDAAKRGAGQSSGIFKGVSERAWKGAVSVRTEQVPVTRAESVDL